MGTPPDNVSRDSPSTSLRMRPERLTQSRSAEESTDNGVASPQLQTSRQTRLLFTLLGLKTSQQNQVIEILNSFTKNGVPQPRTVHKFESADLSKALDYLDNMHSTWMEFIQCKHMTETEIQIQSAIWELVTNEADYIHELKTITDLFVACLAAIQAENILTDIDRNKLFSNVSDICEVNIKFWTLYLYPMVQNSIRTGRNMCISYFHAGFVEMSTIFAPYIIYCAEASTSQCYCKELSENNIPFTTYLTWCESHKLCNRLHLDDILIHPAQRLPKYNLLLAAIRRNISDENDGELLDAMMHSVDHFVLSVNSYMTQRQENERLKGIMARIDSYDVVESNNEQLDKLAKQYSNMIDLCAPMHGVFTGHARNLFMEGDMKFKDSVSKMDVHCFLLTDFLLVCKMVTRKGVGTLKVVRQPYLTDCLHIKIKDQLLYAVYVNELNVAVTAFTLQCVEAKNWYEGIAKARHIYRKLKQVSSTWDDYGMRYQNTTEMLNVRRSPFNSSFGSRVSSLNNSHSGSVDLNESRSISIDYEKPSSLSSDDGMHASGPMPSPSRVMPHNSPTRPKLQTSNTLFVQPMNNLANLGQSLPNLNLNAASVNSNNTLSVPGAYTSGTALLSSTHRGISYPPPSPTRATLRRGLAFSSSIKYPTLTKTRNIQSQNSFNNISAIGIQPSTSSAPEPSASSATEPSIVFGVEQLQIPSPRTSRSSANPSNQSNQSDLPWFHRSGGSDV